MEYNWNYVNFKNIIIYYQIKIFASFFKTNTQINNLLNYFNLHSGIIIIKVFHQIVYLRYHFYLHHMNSFSILSKCYCMTIIKTSFLSYLIAN